MDVLRCPTCFGMLVEPQAERCPTCHERLQRRSPVVLATRGQPVNASTLFPHAFPRRRKGRRFSSRGDAKQAGR
jgi:hypothetical protein